jgi:hypothetical protein
LASGAGLYRYGPHHDKLARMIDRRWIQERMAIWRMALRFRRSLSCSWILLGLDKGGGGLSLRRTGEPSIKFHVATPFTRVCPRLERREFDDRKASSRNCSARWRSTSHPFSATSSNSRVLGLWLSSFSFSPKGQVDGWKRALASRYHIASRWG